MFSYFTQFDFFDTDFILQWSVIFALNGQTYSFPRPLINSVDSVIVADNENEEL